MPKVIVFGPYHPAFLEPDVYEVTVDGDKIIDVNIEQGYTHRGIEKLAATKTYRQNVFLCERICGLCSHAHSCCYCQAAENIFEVEPPRRAKYIRAVVFELERLQNHYIWLALFFHALRDEKQFIKLMNAREPLMDLIELVCGNRVHYSMNAIGGVRRDLTVGAIERTKHILNDIEKLLPDIFETIKSHAQRISGVGVLPKGRAISAGVVGPVLRASGIKSDIRRDDPYAAYDEVDFEVKIEDSCDVLGRALVRANEIYESVKIIRQLFDRLPQGELCTEVVKPHKGEGTSRVEAPRGELIYYIRSDGTNIPQRVKLRPPTYMNDHAVVEMLRGEKLENLLLVLESLDRCISCTNRVAIIDARTGKKRVAKLSDLG
jgi:NADH-quinone oxidoreductase subunit D